MYNETFAKVAWVLVFIGFNLTFLPQFVLGMEGMPRRYYDYLPQFQSMHQLSTVGAYINAIGYSAALFNLVFAAMFSKRKAPSNPYNSLSLEWQTQSPPVHDNFPEVPVVTQWTYGYGEKVEGKSH